MRKRQFFRKALQKNQSVEFYTVVSQAPLECHLVNLSAGGIALKFASENLTTTFCQGDIVFVNLKELGINSTGISARITRVSLGEKHVELGISFVSSSSQFQKEVEELIGWRQLKSSLKKPRAAATQIYNGEQQASELPRWLDALIHSLRRRSSHYMRVENPARPKAHLVEWIETSLDKEQLGVSLTQSL